MLNFTRIELVLSEGLCNGHAMKDSHLAKRERWALETDQGEFFPVWIGFIN